MRPEVKARLAILGVVLVVGGMLGRCGKHEDHVVTVEREVPAPAVTVTLPATEVQTVPVACLVALREAAEIRSAAQEVDTAGGLELDLMDELSKLLAGGETPGGVNALVARQRALSDSTLEQTRVLGEQLASYDEHASACYHAIPPSGGGDGG